MSKITFFSGVVGSLPFLIFVPYTPLYAALTAFLMGALCFFLAYWIEKGDDKPEKK